ncbi:MAG: hypothetical protein ACYSXF_08550 [Planctomycetota bacterium]|jgi:hypothetical protein
MSSRNASHPELSPDDQRLLDALVEAGFDTEALEGLSPDQRRRAEALCNLFGLLSDYPAEDADDTLIHATLARIGRHEEERAARMSFEAQREAEEGNRRRIRMPDFITVAAVLLIAASVLWPIISHAQQRSLDTRCRNNLRLTGYGFSNYASDYNGALPVVTAGTNLSWDKFHNILNLGPLVEGDYCDLGHLDCPGNHEPLRPSYSYQWQSPQVRLVWDAGRTTVVLGDRNPIIDAARSGAVVAPLTISLNHGGRGQNVLISDGAAFWLTQPVVGRQDNIWLPAGATKLEPGISPAGNGDVFLTH